MKLIRKIEASLSSAPIRKKVAAYARISEEKERINSLSEDGECSHYFPPSRRRKAASSAKM